MEKLIISVNMHYLLFLKDITKAADNGQSKFINGSQGIDRGVKLFLTTYDYFLVQEKKFQMILKSVYFQ